MTILNLIVVGLGAGLIVCAALFLIGAQRRHASWRALVSSYVRHLAASVAIAVALTTVAVFAVTAFTNSPQGPLSLVFLGPLAVILGAWTGAIIWLVAQRLAWWFWLHGQLVPKGVYLLVHDLCGCTLLWVLTQAGLVLRRSRIVNGISKTCLTGATHEDETSDSSRFSRKPREFRANNQIRVIFIEHGAWKTARSWATRLSWQTQLGWVK